MIECLNDCVGIAESVNEVIHVKEAQRPRHGPVMRRVTGRVLKEESISETLRSVPAPKESPLGGNCVCREMPGIYKGHVFSYLFLCRGFVRNGCVPESLSKRK